MGGGCPGEGEQKSGAPASSLHAEDTRVGRAPRPAAAQLVKWQKGRLAAPPFSSLLTRCLFLTLENLETFRHRSGECASSLWPVSETQRHAGALSGHERQKHRHLPTLGKRGGAEYTVCTPGCRALNKPRTLVIGRPEDVSSFLRQARVSYRRSYS